MHPTADPWLSASRHSFVAARGAGVGVAQRAERHHRWEERRRDQATSHLFAEHGDFHQPEPEPAFVLGQLDGQPTLFGHGVPGRRVVAAGGVRCGGRGRCLAGPRQRADHRAGADARPQRVVPGLALEQRRRCLAQSLLVGGEVEVHGGAVYGQG